MTHQTTRYLRFDEFGQARPEAIIVTKLMMAFNDMSFANQALADWRIQESREHAHRREAARRYFVRLELSHLHEAMKIVQQVQANATLVHLLKRCSGPTQTAFATVATHAYRGAKHRRFRQLVGNLRDNLTFHYDQCDSLVNTALTDRGSRPEGRQTSIIWGDRPHVTFFEAADQIADSIVVRQIWKIPRNADTRAEIDKIAEEVHDILIAFLEFAGGLAWKFTERS